MHETEICKMIVRMRIRSVKRRREGQLTIQIAHSSIILVLNEHITEFDLCPVHVLTGDHKSGKATTAFNLPMSEDIADLR